MLENIETSAHARSANQICLNTHRCQCVATSPHAISANKTVALQWIFPYNQCLCHAFNNSSQVGKPPYTSSSVNPVLAFVLAHPLWLYILPRCVWTKMDIDLLRKVSKLTPNILLMIIVITIICYSFSEFIQFASRATYLRGLRSAQLLVMPNQLIQMWFQQAEIKVTEKHTDLHKMGDIL